MTPHFYFINDLYYQNVDVCKKLDLKILKFDRLAAVFLRLQIFLSELRKFLKYPGIGQFLRLEPKILDSSYLYLCYQLYKKEICSDPPKMVFNRGGGFHPPRSTQGFKMPDLIGLRRQAASFTFPPVTFETSKTEV